MTNPAVHSETPRPAPASACVLGEGALWDHRDETLLFVDIKNPGVRHFHPGTGKHASLPVPERVGFVALTSDPDMVIAARWCGGGRMAVRRRISDGEADPLHLKVLSFSPSSSGTSDAAVQLLKTATRGGDRPCEGRSPIMPVLDAKALKTDRKGLAFLRAVLRSEEGSDAKKDRKAPETRSPKRSPFSPDTTTPR
ncbi:MAG TPA: SMP-30/gluconolactonase/LRE family protein [Microvirga sp.]|nr:SMP-30/gluconolactonase/LRE family protein [Microvirga sp.]